MALTNIEYGSVASSEVVNNNFQYLDDKISSVSQSLSANTTSLSGSISSLSASVASNKSEVDEKISNIDENLKSIDTDLNSCMNRIYVKSSYRSGKNWYRLYSDSWIEQGGYIAFAQTDVTKNVSLLKEMRDVNASVYVSPIRSHTNGDWDIGIAGGTFVDTKTIRITTGRDGACGGVYWRVSGFVK